MAAFPKLSVVICLLSWWLSPTLAFRSNIIRCNSLRVPSINFQGVKLYRSLQATTTNEVTDNNNNNNNNDMKPDAVPSPLRYGFLFLWIFFTYYAFNLAPPDADSAITLALIQKTVSEPFGGDVNPIYSTIFNLLGVYPALYASLLLPGAGGKKQTIPAQPFVFGSFALGFFGLGPYLAFRNLNTSGSKEDAGFGNGLFESKVVSILLLIGTLFLVFNGVTTELVSGVDKWSDFVQIFSSQRLVHVSTIDFAILTLTVS